jgi:hypothetical protein
MKSCNRPGSRVWLSPAASKTRVLPCTLRLVKTPEGLAGVGLHTMASGRKPSAVLMAAARNTLLRSGETAAATSVRPHATWPMVSHCLETVSFSTSTSSKCTNPANIALTPMSV